VFGATFVTLSMTPEISEFSYGFALTNEIVGWASLKAAPIFPSLIEEGKKGGGYDVKLDTPGVPLYLQFKRADCMTRRSAREISKDKTPLSVPFYRFAITQTGKSDQHALLLELDDGSNEVFYAAPRFHELAEINQAWSASQVAGRSIFVRPAAIGPLDTNSHHIAYDRHRAYLCSKPKPLEFVAAANLAERLSAQLTVETRSLRETIPEFNASLNRAWTRGRERVAEGGRYVVPSVSGLLIPPGGASPGDTSGGVPTRIPEPLPEDLQQLRQLADDAVKLFNAQLVIIQKAG
jgi:hypothetical protein